MLKLPGLFFVTLWGFTMVPVTVAAEKEVELVTDAEFIQPTSTFEFRFATPVVRREEVGTVASNPPIKIDPPAVHVPEAGSTLLMMGLALAAVEGCRRWADRKTKR